MIAFKYRACKDDNNVCRDIDMLLADQIYASPLNQLNDCFEGKYSDNIDKQLDAIADEKYGSKIVSTVSRQLTERYGKGYQRANLFRMLKVAKLVEKVHFV